MLHATSDGAVGDYPSGRRRTVWSATNRMFGIFGERLLLSAKSNYSMERIKIIDTHTGGEPTRVVLSGGPALVGDSMAQRRSSFASQFDRYRRAVCCEPRGSDVMVGAMVTPPERSESVAGVIFFNNVGYLGMCGHGTIGLAVALAHCGRIAAGCHQFDTPVGPVSLELRDKGRATLENVASYRYRRNVELRLADGRCVHGDVAWGGNWFFLCDDHGLKIEMAALEQLHELAWDIRRALDGQGVTGKDSAQIDHIELLGLPSDRERADGRNFVLCPGGAYDRSPCGTGTSAKVACLAADGKLAPGEVWRQESIIGSIFESKFRLSADGECVPSLTGSAYVNSEGELILDPRDPYCMGIAR